MASNETLSPGGTQGRLSNQRGRYSTLIKRLFDSATPGQPQPYAASPTSTRSRHPNAPQTSLDKQTGLDPGHVAKCSLSTRNCCSALRSEPGMTLAEHVFRPCHLGFTVAYSNQFVAC